MISIKDCLDYSDLTEEEVAVIAEHEHMPFGAAVQLTCCLSQTPEGAELIRHLLRTAVSDAESCGRAIDLQAARRAYSQFVANHPEA